MELDPYAARSPTHRYEICSCYLDSEELRLCNETLEGLRDRYKLRIRAYSDLADDPVFFEVKRRNDRRISKERSRVRRPEMLRLLGSGELSRDTVPQGELPSLDSFVAKMQWIGARPRVLVRYSREAYHGSFDDAVRVTFDRQLRAAVCTTPTSFFSDGGWNTVEGGRVVLELKFNDKHPPWIGTLVRTMGLNRISYSKYAMSIQACGSSRLRHAGS